MKAQILTSSVPFGLIFSRRIVSSMLLGSLFASALPSWATTYNWNQSVAATYAIPTDWTPNGPPTSADTAAVGNSTTASGSVLYDNAGYAYGLNILQLGQVSGGNGTFTMSAGSLSITNNSGTGLGVGNFNGGTGLFTMNGGTLTVVRDASGETYYRDVFQMGDTAGATGTFTLNNGSVTCLGGIEIGSGGTGTLNVNGGLLIDNGWFGLGRGGTGNGWGTFNLSGGTAILLRNPNTDSGDNGISFDQGGTNATANISGGTLFCYLIRMHAGPGSAYTDWETFNVSGGDIYLGSLGVYDAGGAGTHHTTITLSGGTFHTANIGPNTGGTLGTNSILPGGTDWPWVASLPATLATSPGPGVVTFAPDATHTITISAPFSGPGALTVNGPGTLAMGGANTYTGNTSVSQGTFALLGSGSISNSSKIIVAGGAMLDASGLSSNAMILSAGQLLTNSSSPALLNGDISTGTGKLELLYAAGTPSFTVVGGTIALATNTTFFVNNTGATLSPGSYKLISATNGGLVSGAGLPPVTVGGGGVAGGQFTSLTVSGGELYLVVTNDHPPTIANDIAQNVSAGATWQIAISSLSSLAGWGDPDGDTVSLSSVGPQSANGTSVTTDGTYIYYNGNIAANDHFTYNITDGKLTDMGTVYLDVTQTPVVTALVPSDTSYVVSLNGLWRFYFERLANYFSGSTPNISIIDSDQPFQQLNYVEGAGWSNLPVPANWEMAGYSPATYYGPDNTSGLYRDWFQVPSAWAGRRVYISFDGVQTSAEIWVNGQTVTVDESTWGINNYHDSGWTDFQVDVTPYVNFGTTNLLAVRVVKQSPSVDLDTGDYFTLGGIFRPVTLYSVPQTNFSDVHVSTHLLPSNQAQVTVTTDVADGDSNTPVSLTLNGVVTVTNAVNGTATFTQIINQPNLWSAEFPNLYPMMLTLKDPTSGQVTETFTNLIGLRELTISNAILYLNGVPLKLAGVCNHDSSGTNGNAMGPDNWRRDILMMKAANINAIRTTHYNFGSGFFDLCDQLGMYVLDELPYCWVSSVNDTTMTPAFQQRAQEVIRRDRNHPSVVVWAIGNENSAGTNLQIVADLVKSLDPTRPRLVSTFPAANYNVELSDRHYPTPATMASDGAAAPSTGHPYIYTEQPNTWDVRLAADAGMWEHWGLAQQRVWSVCLQYDTIVGTFPFEWSDRALMDPNSSASYQSNGVQLLYFYPTGVHLLKLKGMVDCLRDERPNVYEAQMLYSPIQVSNSVTITPGEASFTVTNHYLFTDLSYLTMAWQLQRDGVVIASGDTNSSLAPRTQGTVQLALPTNALPYADTLRVDFIHPDGRDIVTHAFSLASVAGPQTNASLPSGLPIPTFNLITRQTVSDPGLWEKVLRYPGSLTNVVTTPANATTLAQLQKLTATVIGGTNGTQTLGTVTAQYTNNTFSYSFQWTGSTWEVQEIGWTLQMPTNYNHFSWNRAGRWTYYPVTDIGRAVGTATPDSTNADYSLMSMTNAFDFNSTKYNCNWASLATSAGDGLMVSFSPSQQFHCRAGAPSTGGGYILYANQYVSVPNDFTTQVVPDQILSLSSGSNVVGSFSVSSVLAGVTSSNAVASINSLVPSILTTSGGKEFALNFNAISGESFSIWMSTNLMNWTWDGPASEVSAGQYQFIDTGSTNSPQRFYRISSP